MGFVRSERSPVGVDTLEPRILKTSLKCLPDCLLLMRQGFFVGALLRALQPACYNIVVVASARTRLCGCASIPEKWGQLGKVG
jgi:hypothetical protein